MQIRKILLFISFFLGFAALDATPYWLILLALRMMPVGQTLGKGAKAGICVVIAAVVAVVFWAMFFRGGSVRKSASAESISTSETVPAESEVASEPEASEADDLFLELSQTDAGGWLGCHVYLMQDGSYSVTYDYTAENAGIEAEKGTFEIGADGTITMTAEDGTTRTATATANEDGTITYTTELTEVNTSIVCNPTGVYDPNAGSGSEASAKEGLFLELSQSDAGGWLGCHVYLMQDGSYSVTYDYTDENSDIEAEKGTFEIGADGTLTMTSEDGTTHTATANANENGTITYTTELTEVNTSIVCNPTGVYDPNAGSGTAEDPAEVPEGTAVAMYQSDAGGWLGCHVYLMQDGSYSVTYDYTAENAGIEGERGVWTDNGDGTLTMTAEDDTTHTVTVTDNGDGTSTFTVEVTEANTSIVCNPIGKA